MLKELGSATDDQLASRCDVNLNDVRKILYALHDVSLVSVNRTRDERTGWFIFHWRLQPDNIEGFIIGQKKKILEKLLTRLEYERAHDFYVCPSCGIRITFEDSVESLFRCSHCQRSLEHVDNSRVISYLEEKIKTIRRELGLPEESEIT